MGFFDHFPYTNFHELNLDWLLSKMRELGDDFEAFAASNVLKYADPFDWDITKQYEPNTMVRNADDNYIYLSKQPVPDGVSIYNTDYWFRVGDMNSYAQQLSDLNDRVDTKMEMTLDSPEIALVGDSSFARLTDYGDFTDFFNNAHVSNYSTETAKWENVYAQLSSITTDPDIILIWCGANDVGAINTDIGGHFGAPDVADHTVSLSPSTMFEWIKYNLSYIKNRWPEAQIYNLMRPTHPNKVRPIWDYYVFYQSAIMREWAVPVLDLQEMINFSTFISAQNDIFTQSDGVHYNDLGYNRFLPKVSNALQAGSPTNYGMTFPDALYVPGSVVDQNETVNGFINRRNIINWAVRHCILPGAGTSTGSMISKVWATSAGGYTFAAFEAFINNAGNTKIFMTIGEEVYTWTLKTNDTMINIGSVISTSAITSDNTAAWYDLPEGDYMVRNSGISTLSLPAAITSLMVGGNNMMKVRYSYNNDFESLFSVHCEIIPGRNVNIIKGYHPYDGSSDLWYKYVGTQVTV